MATANCKIMLWADNVTAPQTQNREALMSKSGSVFIGKSVKPEVLLLKLANRHGLITGATGTGKTVSLQILAEGFSSQGVPVFCADVKGDLSGIAAKGVSKDFLEERANKINFKDYSYDAFPTIFWDLFGEQGHPIRTTVSEMGPLLLARLMNLNDTQEGVLNIAFRVADEEGLLLLDLKDLRALIANVAERSKELSAVYGNVSKASVGAIQRSLLVLEEQGGEKFFGEPALEITEFMRTMPNGAGYISVLAADKLMQAPRLYATFLLWLLSELFEELPEVGDPDKPKLVFFFDEAHLLFDEAPKALVDKVEQVVRLIRSKGVGVYFVTQNPLDVPDTVSSQLGNRIQHALRAFTPREQRAVKAAAETFRPNPEFKTAEVIMQLGVGEALVSTLEKKGEPSIVQRTLVRPPSSRLGPLTPAERRQIVDTSPVAGRYDKPVDRESAYEELVKRAAQKAASEEEAEAKRQEAAAAAKEEEGGLLDMIFGTNRKRGQRLSPTQRAAREVTRSVVNRTVGQMAADVGRQVAGKYGGTVGRAIVRGILGGVLRR
jgi:DNA helicase HerA-like ATPase